MKKDKRTNLKQLSIEELTEQSKKTTQELAALIMDKEMKQLKNLRSISTKRREVARILTILNQKRLIVQYESEQKGVK